MLVLAWNPPPGLLADVHSQKDQLLSLLHDWLSLRGFGEGVLPVPKTFILFDPAESIRVDPERVASNTSSTDF